MADIISISLYSKLSDDVISTGYEYNLTLSDDTTITNLDNIVNDEFMGNILDLINKFNNNKTVTNLKQLLLKAKGLINNQYKMYEGVIEQFKNIKTILEGSKNAAKKSNIPLVKVIFCLIHKEGKIIDDSIKKLCHLFFKYSFILKLLDDNGDYQYKSQFVYEEFIPEKGNEKEFMNGLKSVGSFIDINKMKNIIKYEGRKHLQMDSNTFIPNWNQLYNNTFGLESQQDSYGASRCSQYYIAVHNKIVYIHESSELPETLKLELNKFYNDFKNNMELKETNRNAIYDYVWGETMFKLNCSHRLAIADRSNNQNIFPFYPAALKATQFTLNKYYLQAQHQAWNPNKKLMDESLKDFKYTLKSGTKVGDYSLLTDLELDSAVVETLFTNYTNIALIHTYKVFFSKTDFQKGYDDSNVGYEDFVLFLNKLNFHLDKIIIDELLKKKELDSAKVETKKREFLEELNKNKVDIGIEDIALDNYAKLLTYIGHTVKPNIYLDCKSVFQLIKKELNPSMEQKVKDWFEKTIKKKQQISASDDETNKTGGFYFNKKKQNRLSKRNKNSNKLIKSRKSRKLKQVNKNMTVKRNSRKQVSKKTLVKKRMSSKKKTKIKKNRTKKYNINN